MGAEEGKLDLQERMSLSGHSQKNIWTTAMVRNETTKGNAEIAVAQGTLCEM